MMKYRPFIVCIMFAVLFAAIGNDARAQEGKQPEYKSRKDKRQERRLKKHEENKDAQTVNGTDISDNANALHESRSGKRKRELNYPKSKIKKRYRVDLILPLYLDELVHGESITFKDKVPDKAALGLAFYQGVKLATDSLQRAGMKMDIYIHDAGSLTEPPEVLVGNRKLDSTDLIIGAVEQHDIPMLATYARKKKVNFVSALTNYDGGVKDNQYFTMLQPSVQSHCEFIIDDLSAKYAGSNVTLLYRTSSLADDNAALYILNDLYSEVTFKKLLCNTLPHKSTLANVFDTSKPNIVVVSILEPAFADSLLRAMAKYFPNTHFEVYGMPTWNEIRNLRKVNKYKNLTVNVTYPFNFETADSTLQQSIQAQYRKEFGGNTSEMVMRGYETMLWYGSMLREYGTIFNEHYKGNAGAPFTKFKIRPRRDKNGELLYLENKHIYLSTYQGGVYRTQ